MPCLRPIVIRSLLLSLWLAGVASAHQVPSMTIEAVFEAGRNFTLRINLDPRVVLSDDPTSLPPVPATWYLEQTPAELTETRQKAMAYLQANVGVQFGPETLPLPEAEIVPMDGATNAAPTADTAEVHLLATVKGLRPEAGGPFQLRFGNEARVSLILLNSLDGQAERRPQVLFPGETSRPFLLPAPAAAKVPATSAPAGPPAREPAAPASKPRPIRAGLIGVAVMALCLLLWRARRRARAR